MNIKKVFGYQVLGGPQVVCNFSYFFRYLVLSIILIDFCFIDQNIFRYSDRNRNSSKSDTDRIKIRSPNQKLLKIQIFVKKWNFRKNRGRDRSGPAAQQPGRIFENGLICPRPWKWRQLLGYYPPECDTSLIEIMVWELRRTEKLFFSFLFSAGVFASMNRSVWKFSWNTGPMGM